MQKVPLGHLASLYFRTSLLPTYKLPCLVRSAPQKILVLEFLVSLVHERSIRSLTTLASGSNFQNILGCVRVDRSGMMRLSISKGLKSQNSSMLVSLSKWGSGQWRGAVLLLGVYRGEVRWRSGWPDCRMNTLRFCFAR
jgi:hypothetical protein